MFKDFAQFIKEYNVLSLAVAFIMGSASNSLVKSLVDDIIMPFVNPIFTKTAWKEAVVALGPIQLKLGSFVSELLHFLILAFIIFFIAKKIMKKSTSSKK